MILTLNDQLHFNQAALKSPGSKNQASQNQTDQNLIDKIKSLRKIESETLFEILNILSEIESRRLFADYGYPSLHAFCVGELSYDDSSANRRVLASRALRENRAVVQAALAKNAVTLTTLAQAQRHFQYERSHNKRRLDDSQRTAVLHAIEGKSVRETERTLAELSPRPMPARAQSMTTINHDCVRFTFLGSQALKTKFDRLKELYAHKNRHSELGEMLEWMADLVLAQKDPTIRHERRETKRARAECRATTSSAKSASHILSTAKATMTTPTATATATAMTAAAQQGPPSNSNPNQSQLASRYQSYYTTRSWPVTTDAARAFHCKHTKNVKAPSKSKWTTGTRSVMVARMTKGTLPFCVGSIIF